MGFLFIIFFWLIFCVLVAAYANQKGLSALGFFILSLLLSPLIGILVALIQPNNEQVLSSRMLSSGKCRQCPDCAELVKSKARVCKHCGRDLELPSNEEIKIIKDEWLTSFRTDEDKDKAARGWAGQKLCSICGESKSLDAFSYGNRDNRSYCFNCNKIDQRIYSSEGLDAVHAWRDEMRRKWKT